ncbi:MAG: P-II family nitrogen regulator [Treponema sp.]|nr:transcriptional regulator [Spirochaetia bacterium]MDD7460504.1 P-II family nitrogen regulator [Spirochaetales bacterium]MDY5812050.1 P-II family nitrogen regulator [Treponema sp.]MEE1182249.1 P-II family nitrogen regulator [Treponema sp.]
MSSHKLITVIVPHNKSNIISESAQKSGSFGGTVLTGRGISANKLLGFLGLGETSLDIVIILTESEKCPSIISSIVDSVANEKKYFGVAYSTNAGQLLKVGNITGDKPVMNGNTKYQLITVILNKGFADDAMEAARNAGAGGGTVLNARGTAKADDEKFFGVHIVPEKEMLQIVVSEGKMDAVINAIKQLPCLSEPGSGICFCSQIEDFYILGKNN